MKANELRIGNYIKADKIKIARMGLESDDYCQITALGIHHIENGDIIAEPIPLTEEWLIKFGFERFQGWLNKDAFSPGHPSQRFDLYWSKIDGFMMKSRYQEDVPDTFYMRHIKFVHQLQNLYFALTGNEII
jgi:hypothetical protein